MLLMMIVLHLMIDASNIFGDILPILYDFLQRFLDIFTWLNVIMPFHDKRVWWCGRVKMDRWLEEERDNKPVRTGTLPPWIAKEIMITSGNVPEVWPSKKITPIGPGNSRVSSSIRPYKIRSVLGQFVRMCVLVWLSHLVQLFNIRLRMIVYRQ